MSETEFLSQLSGLLGIELAGEIEPSQDAILTALSQLLEDYQWAVDRYEAGSSHWHETTSSDQAVSRAWERKAGVQGDKLVQESQARLKAEERADVAEAQNQQSRTAWLATRKRFLELVRTHDALVGNDEQTASDEPGEG